MELKFDGTEMKLQEDFITTQGGGRIPVTLTAGKLEDAEAAEFYIVTIDGVLWAECESLHHAIIIYTLLRDHVTEYMNYITKGGQ